jgi:uncharacterized membrane protein
MAIVALVNASILLICARRIGHQRKASSVIAFVLAVRNVLALLILFAFIAHATLTDLHSKHLHTRAWLLLVLSLLLAGWSWLGYLLLQAIRAMRPQHMEQPIKSDGPAKV